MKRLLILLLGLLLIGSTKSQEKTDAMLFGDVKSAKTKEHISYATIVVKGTTIGTTTDGSGHYKLANLPVGKCTIVARAVGYKSEEREVIMEKGKAVKIFFELEEDVLLLDQVVVTATRSEHHLKNVPVRTEIISAKTIENKNACNIYQALEGTPGVRVENQCQYCNFTMVRMQGLGAEHTQVLINGQPMYSGLAGVYGLQQLSTIDVDKIEVVKGAGSALYGSGAIAGAINIVTKEPSFVPSTTLDIQFGNHKTNKFDINSSMRNEKGNIGLNVFAQRYSEGAIDQTGPGMTTKEVRKKDGISDRVMSNLTNAGFGLYINNAFMKNDKLIIRGKSVFEKREGGTITDDYFRNPLTDGTENITTDRYEASINYEKKIKTKSAINLSVAYTHHNRNATNDSYLNDYMATHGDTVPDLRDMRPYLANENSLTSTLTFNTTLKKHSLIVGLQFFYDVLKESGMYVVVDETSSFLGESYRSTANKSAREIGLFIQDEWTIGKKIMIVPGIRLDHHHSGEKYTSDQQVFESTNFPKTKFDETAVNPRLAIKYEISKKFTLRANAGTGFRAPYGFSEDLHLCSGSPRVWKSSDLNPERSISYNISADYYGKRIRISTNIFRTDLKNKIGFTDADSNIAALGYDYQWKNIDNAFVQGVELSIMANLAKNLDMGVDFTYNHGKYKNVREDWVGTKYEKVSKYISRFPSTTGNIKIEYSPKTWTFSVTGNFQGNMYIDYYSEDETLSKIKKTKPNMIFNARVSKKLSLFKLYAGVNNIFNYVQDERHLDDAAFMYAPVYGTMFYGGVSINISH
ncbi:MAG TPA: TonB-dependent receptor [Bacteroidales bacterium]|nr:TonB-dependent receptor [Bacteroidales bacterium]HOR82199.1 TonB-dependent receptor [Bacteroidales bacterium]HPJ91351.1 TonB-dependent receptor [Bacteroidales bacterium]HQB19594.1 TonB-dependent receptor [Bacteroidales bacterium]